LARLIERVAVRQLRIITNKLIEVLALIGRELVDFLLRVLVGLLAVLLLALAAALLALSALRVAAAALL
jgi:hypothetical protein